MRCHDGQFDSPADGSLEARLRHGASREYRQPPNFLHARIMDAVRHRTPVRAAESPLPFPWRMLAVAACLALSAGFVMYLSSRVTDAPTESQIASNGANVHEPSVAAAPNLPERAGGEALATVTSFLQRPALLESEMTEPLRSEWARLASAGEEFIEATIRSLPPSLRAGAR